MTDTAGAGTGGAGAAGMAAGMTGGGQQQPAGGQGGTGGNGGTPADVPAWAATYPDELKATIAGKGWKDPADAVKGYAELHKMFGADRHGRTVVLPTDENDKAGWDGVWNKLGRPEKPDGYGLDKVPGADPGMVKWAASTFHELGVPARLATGLAQKWGEYVGGMAGQQQAETAQKSAAELDELKNTWGPTFPARVDLAQRYALQLVGPIRPLAEDLTLADGTVMRAGSPDPRDENFQTLVRLENALGTKRMYELFYNQGQRLGELRSPMPGGGGSGGGLPATAEGARAEITRLGRDDEFQKKAAIDGSPERQRWDELYKVAYPE
jgi:hypothetical protein